MIRAKRENVDFRGTSVYASPNTHNKQDQSPKDDIYSLFFVFLDLLYGKLIWTEYSRNRANKDHQEIQNDKNMTAELKQLCLDDIDTFLDLTTEAAPAFTHASSTSTDSLNLSNSSFTPKAIMSNWKSSLLEDDFEAFTQRLRTQSRLILTYLKGLTFEDFPDYNLLKNAFMGMLLNPTSVGDVGSLEYSKFGFNWKIACGASHESASAVTMTSVTTTVGEEALNESAVVRLLSKPSTIQNIIVAKGKYLGRQINKALAKNSVSGKGNTSRPSIAESSQKAVDNSVTTNIEEAEQPNLKRLRSIQPGEELASAPIIRIDSNIGIQEIGVAGMDTELDESEFGTSIEQTAFTGISSAAALTRKSSFADFDQQQEGVAAESNDDVNINRDIDALLSEVAASFNSTSGNVPKSIKQLNDSHTPKRHRDDTEPSEVSKAPCGRANDTTKSRTSSSRDC